MAELVNFKIDKEKLIQKSREKKIEERLTEHQGYIVQYEAVNIFLIISKGEELEKGTGNIFEEIVAKTIPNFVENIKL